MKKTNRDTIILILLLAAAAVLLAAGLISGRINLYVHPRYNMGLWISAIVLVIFAASFLLDKKKGRHNVNFQKYLIYLVPLVFTLIFPPTVGGRQDKALAESTLGAGDTFNQGGSAAKGQNSGGKEYAEGSQDVSENQTGSEGQDTSENQDGSESQDISESQTGSNGQDTSGNQTGSEGQDTSESQDLSESQEGAEAKDVSAAYHAKKNQDSYVIGDTEFSNWFMDVYNHLPDFMGQRYQFLAQVYSMDDLGKNQFLAGRYFMVCCAADVQAYGFICNFDKREELKEDEWITVTATISKCDYQGTEVPLLKDAVITKAKAPKDEYVYYNSY